MNDMFESIKKSFNKGYSFILNYSTAEITIEDKFIEVYSETLGTSIYIDEYTNGTLVDGHWTWNSRGHDWELIAYEVKKFEV